MDLFADFNCPYSFALYERLLAIGEIPDWHGVEHAPGLPIPASTPPDPHGFEREIAEVRSHAPDVHLNQPSILPNTARALAIAAAAARDDLVGGAEFRIRVFRALWVDGRDISDPNELRDIARMAGLPRGVVEQPGSWTNEISPVGGVPAIVRNHGRALKGLVSTSDLKEFLAGAMAHDIQGVW